jgi:DNA-binding NarL/FixJ family response regulator
MSSDSEKVDTILSVHIQQCGTPEGPSERVISVIVGNSDSELTVAIRELIRTAAPDGAEVGWVFSAAEARRLERYTRTERVDLCVLVLNNLIFPDGNEWPARIEKALKFLTHMRTKCGSVIVLAGPLDDPRFADKARRAGADCFLPLPFEAEEFIAAIRKALTVGS